MNSKIKELLQKSGFQYVEDEGLGWCGNYNSSLPKFVSLLILECSYIADQAHSKAQGGMTAGAYIRKQLEVEKCD